MANVNEDQVQELLRNIKYPGGDQDIVTAGLLEHLKVREDSILIILKYRNPDSEIQSQIYKSINSLIQKEFPEYKLELKQINLGKSAAAKQLAGDPWTDRAAIPGVRNILAVASGKGGVGKSTVSTNLAIALSQQELKVGLMDSDIYGPSVHIMMGIDEKPMVSPEEKLVPINKFGIKMMSMGFLIDKETPLIWRGPIVQKAVTQFLRDVDWGELDILVIDLPPGTGDVQLTLVQKTPINGAIIVTTPQEVALVDARRGYHMFRKVDTRVLGIVENMSYFSCTKCNEKHYIFGEGGGSRAAKKLEVPFLGEIPIVPEITESGDMGVPIVTLRPENEASLAFKQIAARLVSEGMIE